MKRILHATIALLLTSDYQLRAQCEKLDSLISVATYSKNDSLKSLAAIEASFCYAESDSALFNKYWNLGYNLAVQKNMPFCEIKAHIVKGFYCVVTNKGDSALYFLETGLEKNKIWNYPELEARLLNNLGTYYWSKNDFVKAQFSFLKALEANEKAREERRMDKSNILSNIGLIYQQQSLYEKALLYHEKALKIREQKKFTTKIPTSYINIAACYNHLNRTGEAIIYYQKAADLSMVHQNYHAVSTALGNLALIYRNTGEPLKALETNLKILNLNTKVELSHFLIMQVYGEIAANYLHLNKPNEALHYIEKGLKMIETDSTLRLNAGTLYHYASVVYYIKNQPEKGYKYISLRDLLAEEIYKTEYAEQLSEMEVKYETSKKEQTITEQALALSEKDKVLARRNAWIIGITSLFILSLATFYFINSRRRALARKEEEEKINRVIFESEQKERIRIARDLHDSIGQKLSVMKMLLPKANGDENLTKVANYLDETATEVRSISHNLIPEILNFGLVKAIEEMADRINSTENIHVEFTADEAVKNKLLPKQTELSLYRIVQEILSNIVRHAKSEKILIELKSLPQFIQINIQDNGVGFDTNAIDRSDGLGWKNIFARIKLINGEIRINSKKDMGSNFLINIPIT